VTNALVTRDIEAPVPTVNRLSDEKPAMPAKTSFCASITPISGYENVWFSGPLLAGSSKVSSHRSCGRWTGSRRSISPSIRLKIAVLAPMPSASVTTAAAANPLFLRNVRSA
jgi:hypothetical protein